MSAAQGDAFVERLLDLLGSFGEMELRMLQTDPRPSSSLAGVAATAREAIAESSSELRKLLLATSFSELEIQGHTLAKTVAARVRSRMKDVEIFENWAPACIEGSGFLAACQRALGENLPPLLTTIEASTDFVRGILEAELRKIFRPVTRWEVAVGVDGAAIDPGEKGSDLVLTWQELRERWGVGEKDFTVGAVVVGARPGDPYAIATNVEASDQHDAGIRGLLMLDIALAAASIDRSGQNQLEIGPVALIRAPEPVVHFTTTRPTTWTLQLKSENLRKLSAELHTTLDGLRGLRKMLWHRLGAALLHARDAARTNAPHRRFSALWFALEALFDNLDVDEETAQGSAGGRVSARVAALQVPDDWMDHMTFEQMRAFYADVAFGLYGLRNLTVHEGELSPAVDDVITEQLEQLASRAIRTVLVAARSADIHRVEEVVAWFLEVSGREPSSRRGN